MRNVRSQRTTESLFLLKLVHFSLINSTEKYVWEGKHGGYFCMNRLCLQLQQKRYWPWLIIYLLQMFLSIAFAAVGVAGALYSFTVAVLGLQNGPLCKVLLIWSTPFKGGWVTYLATFLKFPWSPDPSCRPFFCAVTTVTWLTTPGGEPAQSLRTSCSSTSDCLLLFWPRPAWRWFSVPSRWSTGSSAACAGPAQRKGWDEAEPEIDMKTHSVMRVVRIP